MQSTVVAIFALMIAAAGWYYLFSSRSADRLAGIESQAINRKRATLRRVGGALLIALAMLFYIGVAGVDWDRPTLWFAATWIAVLMVLGAVTLLAVIDLRLTGQLRKRRP